MNVQYLKYVVEVANYGSVSRAAEKLYVAQPNLSRAIKELEKELNVTIFSRTPHGVVLTADGEELVSYAKTILSNIDEVESLFRSRKATKSLFSVSVPRADYVGYAFTQFTKSLSQAEQCEIYYKETNALRAVNNIVHADYRLGVIRYNSRYDKYFKDMLEQKSLACELIAQFNSVLVCSSRSPLAQLTEVSSSQVDPLIEVTHSDPFVPSLSAAEVRKTELPDSVKRRIFLFERASRLEVLSQNEQTYAVTSPIPPSVLQAYSLVQLPCSDLSRNYKDLLIYKQGYKFSKLDRDFITELCLAKRKFIAET